MWSILGINKTKNRIEIKEAYMSKIQKINPEDDEEGFKRLRVAYEEALKFAESEDITEIEDTSQIGIWRKKVKEIYHKFSLRIDEESWRKILEDEVCFSIDSRVEAGNKLLEFLMDYYYLPKEIWLLLDECFSWTGNREELIEDFPEDFINFVINKVNSNYSDSIEYDLFEEIDDSIDYDNWIDLYLKIRRQMNEGNLEEAEKDLSKIEELHIKHPSLKILYIRYHLLKEEFDKAKEIGEDLLNRYPDKDFAIYSMAVIQWNLKNYELAKEYYEKNLEIKINDYNSKVGLADCYLEIGDFKASEKIFKELLNLNRNDGYVRDKLFTINNKHIDELEKECSENTKDNEIKLRLGWYYFENYRYDDVINLCEKFEPEKEDANQYFDLISRAYIAKDKYDLALKYINKWEEKLKADEDVEVDELELFYYEKGRVLSNLREYEQALAYLDKSLEIYSDNILVLNAKANVLNKLERYEQSLKIIEQGLELDSSDVLLHINKAEALFELRNYREAMDECDITIDIYPYYINPYLIKMKIYAIYDEYDAILEIADELERLEINDFDTNIYKIKALTDKNRIDEAQNLAISMLKAKSKNKDKLHKVYYELAVIRYNERLYEKALGYILKAIKSSAYVEEYLGFRANIYRALNKFDLAINDYDNIIQSKDKQHGYLISLKAETYEEMGKLDKAIELYKEVLKLNPQNGVVTNFSIGKLYYESNNYDKALEYYNKQLEIEEDACYYIYRGVLYARNNKIDEAIADYKAALQLEPENPYPYNNLACIYKDRNEYEEAIRYYEKAVELDKDGKESLFYNNLSDCYVALNNADMALKYFDEANKSIKHDENFYLDKAKLFKRLKLYNEATETYKEALKAEDIASLKIYEEMAWLLEKLGEYEKSIECYNEILKFKKPTQYRDEYRNIGYLYYKLKDYKNAIKHYELHLKPNSYYTGALAKNKILIADCYEELNKKEEAIKNYTEALNEYLNSSWETPDKYIYIGKCYKGLGKNSEAIENFEKALNLELCFYCKYGGCFEAYFGIGEVYEKERKYEEALKYYKKSLEINEDDKFIKEAIERVENLAQGKVRNFINDIRNRFRNNK